MCDFGVKPMNAKIVFNLGSVLSEMLNNLIIFSNLPAANKKKLMQSLDTDGDGKIDLEEFRQLFKK